MSVGIVDIFIVLFVLMGGIVGYKNGAIKEGVQFVGLLICLIVAFIFKDQLMILMYENLPFFNFFGIIRGLDAINVLFYQLIAFIVIFAALMFILKVLIVITGFVELLLKMTVFLSVPSKIIGIFVGMIEFYVYVFVVLYILNMPIFNLSYVADSKYGNIVLENTPILSSFVDNTVNVYVDVWNIIKNRDKKSNKEVNTLVLVTLLDNKLITVDSARKLVSANKIIIEDESILDDYEDGLDISKILNAGRETLRTGVKSVNDQITFDNTEIQVVSISDELCVFNGNCNEFDELTVVLYVKTSSIKKNYTLLTDGKEQLLTGTDNYIFAEINNGQLNIGYVR